jgi:hypothetical protein
VDYADHVTVAWLRAGHAWVRRDLGAGFLATQDLGAADSYALAVDRATSNVTLLTLRVNMLYIQRSAPTTNTWAAMIPMNMGFSTMLLKSNSSVVFDGAGPPDRHLGAGRTRAGLELFYAKCR